MKKISISILMLFVLINNSYGQDFELVPYRNKTKWGFADSAGVIKIKPVYDNVIPFNRGYSAFKRDDKWGFIDISGKEILEAKYDSVGEYFDGYYIDDKTTNKQIAVTGLRVFKDGHKDVVDIKGQSIDTERLSAVVDEAEDGTAYKEKVELIRTNNKVGFKIKKSGFTIEPQYDSLIYSDTDIIYLGDEKRPRPYFLAKKYGNWGIITTKNTVKLAFEYEKLIELEFNGNKIFKKNGKWGVMDKNFAIQLKNEYDSLIYERGKYLSQYEKKWGVLDNKFNVIVPFEYTELKMSSDKKGFYVKDNTGKWGFCDKNGELKIPMEYAFLEKYNYTNFFKYSNDSKGRKFGLINMDQTIKIEAKYDDIQPFKNGYALVIVNGKQGYINENGLEFFKK